MAMWVTEQLDLLGKAVEGNYNISIVPKLDDFADFVYEKLNAHKFLYLQSVIEGSQQPLYSLVLQCNNRLLVPNFACYIKDDKLSAYFSIYPPRG